MATGDSTGQDAARAPDEPLAEPSMGPACLVIAILMLAIFMAVCAFGSFIFFSDQPALAKRAITQELIPWVESSTLSPSDKQAILGDLQDVVGKVDSRELTTRQLSRLKNALEDNPVLLWGTVEGVLAGADEAGMPEVEIQSGQRVVQRLLRSAAERKLSRNDLVYQLEGCTHTRTDGQGLEINTPLEADQVRSFLKRAESFVDGRDVAKEPYEKTVAEVFRALVDEALSVK